MKSQHRLITLIAILVVIASNLSVRVSASLIAYWKFDETSGATAYDECCTNDANISGATINQDGRASRAYFFDGTDDYISVSDPLSLTSSTGAVEYWMKADIAQNGTVFCFYEMAYTDYIRSYLYSDGRLDLLIEDNNETKVYVYYDLDNLADGYVGKWIHVLWVQDGSSVKLYINGEAKTLSGTNSGDWWSDHLTLSSCIIGWGPGWDYFDGSIDEFRVYDASLNADEAYACYEEIFTTGDWAFDDGSGYSTVDFSLHANDGVLYNMSSGNWVEGIQDSALHFDGGDDKVIVGHDANTSSETGTIEYWINVDVAHSGTIFNFYETLFTDYIRSHLHSDGFLDLVIEDSNAVKVAVGYDLDKLEGNYVGEWLHVVWVQDGNGVKCYINGKEKPVDEDPNSGNWWSDHLNLSNCVIGFGQGWGYFDGIIDEFKTYTRALSKEEVVENYKITGGNWHFSEGSGTSTVDSSEYKNDLTLSGASWVAGVLDSAINLDGSDDKVTILAPSSLTSAAGAIEYWMKADVAQNGTIFCFYETAYTDYIRSYLDSYGKLDLIIEDGNDVKLSVEYDLDNIPGGYVGKWLHIMWVQDGSSVKLYINGEAKTLSGTNSGDWWSDHLTLSSCIIGWGPGWDYFDGSIDEFKIYRRKISATEAFQLYIDHGEYKQYGCESNPTGDPIGGGSGYSKILCANDADYDVDTKVDFLSALSSAASGDIIFVSADIDLTGEDTITIPAGVTLAGDRGYNDSSGALLKTDTVNIYYTPFLITGGSDVRITGLRIQGPGATTTTNDYSDGVRSAYANLEVDNCEISAWGHAAVALLPGGTDAYVHHNYIHHCQRDGYGYGISHGYGDADSLIEANKFDYNRHSVAGTGTIGNSYEARYNLVLENAPSHVFDMHGGADRNDGTDDAGDNIYIHHNTVKHIVYEAVRIRGIPTNEALIYKNWFYSDVGENATRQINAFGNYFVYDNLYTAEGYYRSNDE